VVLDNRDIKKELGSIAEVPRIPKSQFSRLRLEDIDNDADDFKPHDS